MASSDPARPPPPLLLPPPEPAPPDAPALPPVPEHRPRPSTTVVDSVLGLLRLGEAFVRAAFRGNAGHATSPSPRRPAPPQHQHHHHHNRPGDIMKRLQREAFPDVMRLMDKHEQIERILSMYRTGKGFHFPEMPVRVKVAIDAVGALLLVDDDEFGRAREVLGKAGNRTGLGSRFVMESKTRGRDTIAAEFSTSMLGEAGARLGEATGGRPLELTRLQYCAHVNDWLSMILVPFGAQCSSFLHGPSLIENVRSEAPHDCPPSFSEQHDCAAGLSITGSSFTASLAELVFGSGTQDDADHGVANRMTTFAQVCYEPADDVKLSLSGLWQIRPSSSRFHNLATLAVPLGSLKPQTNTPPPPLATTRRGSSVMVQRPGFPAPVDPIAMMVITETDPAPSAAQSVAVMAGCELYEAKRAEAWVEMERRGSGRGPVRWGCCLSDTPEHELGWGVRMGSTAEGDEHRPHLEGFLSFNLGRGGKLQPGLVYVMEEKKWTPALVLRSSWFM